jgi:hypothetical protein
MIGNIFINKFENEGYSANMYSLINRLSEHDAQVPSLSAIILPDDRNEFFPIGKLVNIC